MKKQIYFEKSEKKTLFRLKLLLMYNHEKNYLLNF